MIKKKEIKKIRDEVLKNWDVSSDKLLTILNKRFKRLPEGHYEHAEALQFVSRYIDYCKLFIEYNDDQEKDSLNVANDNIDYVKNQIIKEWTLKKYIHAKGEFYLSQFIASVKIANWIDQEYEIKYLQTQIKIIEDEFETESTERKNVLFKINQQYIMGKYPDVFTENPDIISYVEASIGFRKFLKARLAKLLPSSKQEQFSIQGVIKGEKDYLGNLTITIPMKQIEQSLKQSLEKDLKVATVSGTNNELRYYTRKQTAEILSVSLDTLNEWVNKGYIKKYRIGGKQVRFKQEDIEKALKKVEVYPF